MKWVQLLSIMLLVRPAISTWPWFGVSKGLSQCELDPKATQGPYYLDRPDLKRVDITEGRPGIPLKLKIVVYDSKLCELVSHARVDIWQCDADGVYSGVVDTEGYFNTTGQTFLRGTQYTARDGAVTFHTIFPGWYPGRAIHIHHQIYIGKEIKLIGQIYFDPVYINQIQKVWPYKSRIDANATDVPKSNSNDKIYKKQGGAETTITKLGGNARVRGGYTGVIHIGINVNIKKFHVTKSYDIYDIILSEFKEQLTELLHDLDSPLKPERHM